VGGYGLREGVTAARRGAYGIDAPYVPLGYAVAGVLAAALALFNAARGDGGALWWLIWSAGAFVCCGCYLYTTLRGKFVVWAEVLRGVGLRGDERLLDLGCGRGAVLLQAAQALPRGRAIGLDRWKRGDQSGNDPAATRQNAALEGVAARVTLQTADMRALPFADGSFDLVVSSLAIHNIPDAAGRAAAIAEAARVLRPGGRVLIADIRATREYAETLRRCGLDNVALRGLGWRFWYSGPWMATRLVTARKAG